MQGNTGTMRQMLLVTLSFFISASTLSAATGKFLYQGFSQGMSESQGRKLAEQRGMQFHLLEQSSEKMKQYVVGQNQDIAMFCAGRLMAYSFSHPSDFQRFVNMLMTLKNQGYQVMGANPNSFFAYDGKNHTSIELQLGRAGDGFRIHMTLFSSEDYGVTNSQTQYRGLDFEQRCF